MDALTRLILNPKYTKKKVTLSDGRVLSYSECGNIDSGMPVLFCFGLMTSSLAIMFAHHRALRNNLRIIAVDYPGIGESTFQPDRTLDGWADDITQFLDEVLGRYSKVRLLGHSLGGLHVLALLSNRSFKKRVVRTVLLCPWLYIDGDRFNPLWMKVTQKLPGVFQSSVIPFVLTGLSSSSMKIATWSNPEMTQVQAAKLVMEYAYQQGQAGNEQMVRFALSKSDTYLPQETESPILVYYGKQDALVLESSTVELIRLLKERKCNVKGVAVEDCDHNSVLSNVENLIQVMSSLVGDADSWAAEIAKSLGVDKSLSMPEIPSQEVDKSPLQKTRSANAGWM
ncbi:alpha/beta fold family hydrolase [Nitzschia inconspicua]|uniref:Alpha/beta fold family hydrolase n=1 Tax=Nitzschia inconspicua TaxID=303405 RepID=A0A9K3LMT7_9STRA|nr:alpha/beta fold family hydrolase [Nitzschia inconspicua]